MISRWPALSLAVLAAACSSEPTTPPVQPDIRAVDLAGLEAELQANAGKGLLVNFWATW